MSKILGTELTLDNLQNLLLIQLQDLASAEDQLIEALPKIADAASCSELRSAFLTHLKETRQQRVRLDRAFRGLGVQPTTETCEAMRGLIKEGNEIFNLSGDPQVKDAALIAAAQRVEHYEMAAYGSARAFARQLGRDDIAELLQETLDEEGNADKILTDIAESHINAQAGRA
jgi:ferritin-like metal-binding protein YciE